MSTDNGRRIVSRSFDPDEGEMIEWLWLHRLVKAAFNLMIGEGKVGKGTLVSWLISQCNRAQMNGGRPCRWGMIGYEDSWTKVWVPRLSKAGARRGMVHELKLDGGGQIRVREDLDLIMWTVKKLSIEALYIDQVLDNLSLETDAHAQKQVRDDLSPLQVLTEEAGITVLGTMHPKKGKASTFREWASGSPAFVNMARQSLGVFHHPEDGGKRIVTVGSSNYGELGHGLSFEIESGGVMIRNNRGRRVRGKTQYVSGEMEPYDEYTADELVVIEQQGGLGVKATRQRELDQALTSLLIKPVYYQEVIDTCHREGLGSRDMVRRAAKRLKVKSDDGMWILP